MQLVQIIVSHILGVLVIFVSGFPACTELLTVDVVLRNMPVQVPELGSVELLQGYYRVTLRGYYSGRGY